MVTKPRRCRRAASCEAQLAQQRRRLARGSSWRGVWQWFKRSLKRRGGGYANGPNIQTVSTKLSNGASRMCTPTPRGQAGTPTSAQWCSTPRPRPTGKTTCACMHGVLKRGFVEGAWVHFVFSTSLHPHVVSSMMMIFSQTKWGGGQLKYILPTSAVLTHTIPSSAARRRTTPLLSGACHVQATNPVRNAQPSQCSSFMHGVQGRITCTHSCACS